MASSMLQWLYRSLIVAQNIYDRLEHDKQPNVCDTFAIHAFQMIALYKNNA